MQKNLNLKKKCKIFNLFFRYDSLINIIEFLTFVIEESEIGKNTKNELFDKFYFSFFKLLNIV
jgi:hypothetical protein